ncbi:BrnA antitoxin family protein [Ghiorsea bivora]|uniref:BrnA antitoxin family protein n=1 Tax=Ghiorsea bivora TaxID=1485545 RepID=UPI0005709435|nr:BrnA antitoxin family protein [Ghiorsea bivora]
MKTIPDFKNEQEEREFWETHDSTDYVDMSKTQLAVFPSLKPTTKAISLRLPEDLLAKIKVKANKMDVPYQSLIKTWLNEKVT